MVLYYKHLLLWDQEAESASKVMGTVTILSASLLFLSLDNLPEEILCGRARKSVL